MKKQLLTLLIGFFPFITKAQNLKTYNGVFENGVAKYTYYENEKGERVYHGNFEYTEKGKDLSLKDIYGQVVAESASIKQIIGQNKNGKATGERKRKVFLVSSTGSMDLTTINPNNSKLVEEITYHYDEKGEFLGGYSYVSYDVKTGKVEKKITASIKDNHFVDKYESVDYRYNPVNQLSGSFNDEGYFDGEWNFINANLSFEVQDKYKLPSNTRLKENRKYRNGLLLSIKEFDNTKGNLIYEYNDVGYTSEKYPNVIRDSVKFTFNTNIFTVNRTNRDYKIAKNEYLLYPDYTNLYGTELLPMGMSLATEFAHICNFVKMYTYRYKLTPEERPYYKSKGDCFELINSTNEHNKLVSYGSDVQFKRQMELAIMDSVYYIMSQQFLQLFDEKQQKYNSNRITNSMCYAFYDTLGWAPQYIIKIPEQVREDKKIKAYYDDFYMKASNKLNEGNITSTMLFKSTKNMPYNYYDISDKTIAKEYQKKLEDLIVKVYNDVFVARQPIVTVIKHGVDSNFLTEIDKSNEKLKAIDSQYEKEMIELIKFCKFPPKFEESYINRMKKSKG